MTLHTFQQRDRLLQKETDFPAAGSTTKTEAVDLGPITHLGYRNMNMEFEFSSPELSATQLPASASVTYTLEFCNEPTFTDGVSVFECNDWKQTGSTNGAEEIVRRFRVSTDSKRYCRLTCKNIGGALTGLKFMFEQVT